MYAPVSDCFPQHNFSKIMTTIWLTFSGEVVSQRRAGTCIRSGAEAGQLVLCFGDPGP